VRFNEAGDPAGVERLGIALPVEMAADDLPSGKPRGCRCEQQREPVWELTENT
jgi:hypothetical protein